MKCHACGFEGKIIEFYELLFRDVIICGWEIDSEGWQTPWKDSCIVYVCPKCGTVRVKHDKIGENEEG